MLVMLESIIKTVTKLLQISNLSKRRKKSHLLFIVHTNIITHVD